MTQSSKFSFRNLNSAENGGGSMVAAAPKKRSYTDAQISEIQHHAFLEGQASGRELAISSIEMNIENQLEQIIANLSDLFLNTQDQIEKLQGQAAELALTIAKKFVPALIEENPTAEIERLFASCVGSLTAEPRIVIRVEESIVDILKDKIDSMARKAGYPGRIVLIGETYPHQAVCRIEWVDGGVTHRSPEQMNLIEQKIMAYTGKAFSDVNSSEANAGIPATEEY